MPNMKPILFNTEMVRAILDGRKTTTRRVIKNGKRTPTEIGREKFYTYVDELNGKPFYGAGFYNDSDIFCVDGLYHTDAEYFKMQYQVGDILYVRETALIQSMKNFDKKVKMYFKADDTLVEFDVSEEEYNRLLKYEYPKNRWLSPYWLTKETVRIFLRVTGVTAERLQDITEEQAKKEGFKSNGISIVGARCEFVELWNSTIKKQDLDKYGWNANPYVWVIEFERCEKP